MLDSSYNKALSLGIVCEMFLREVNEINIQKSNSMSVNMKRKRCNTHT
ncbi:hypothetical protein [Helicobacter cinaedi]|nr:hypothetical protein [Helicobacter cinaedi]